MLISSFIGLVISIASVSPLAHAESGGPTTAKPAENITVRDSDETNTMVPAEDAAKQAPPVSTLDKIKSVAELEYYGLYYGPAIGNFSRSYSNEYGHPLTDQFLLNYIYTGYKVTPNIIPGVTVLSDLEPVSGGNITMLDPYLRLTTKGLFRGNGFDMYQELRYFVPATQESHDLGKLGTFGVFDAVTYQVPNSRFTVGAWGKFYWGFFNEPSTSFAFNGIHYVTYKGVPNPLSNGQLYFRPNLFYTFSPRVQGTLYYEMYASHFLHDSFWNWDHGAAGINTDVQVGAMVTIVNGLMLNPYIIIQTGGAISTQSTAIGGQIFITLF
ncbi:MAG: hypothetical protein P4M08_09265 [Oligoflexia bacterium]|nr:hypothetical protein [Oligoflexia bacterium]